ncbi:MAG: hypothetical protein JWN14_208 [Chthonomonadales bacterium]|nr:hypothetical protein [Chthonomonadales bacterium]
MGVCVLPEPPRNAGRTAQYADYIEELLAHAGLRYTRIRLDDLPGHLASLRVLLTVGDASLTDARKQALEQWVRQGGAWLSVAGVCGLEAVLGVTPELPTYASWGVECAIWGRAICMFPEHLLLPKLPWLRNRILSRVRLPSRSISSAASRSRRPARTHWRRLWTRISARHDARSSRKISSDWAVPC